MPDDDLKMEKSSGNNHTSALDNTSKTKKFSFYDAKNSQNTNKTKNKRSKAVVLVITTRCTANLRALEEIQKILKKSHDNKQPLVQDKNQKIS